MLTKWAHKIYIHIILLKKNQEVSILKMSSSNKVHLSLKNAIMSLNVSNRNARNFLGLKKAPCKTDPSKKYKLQGFFFGKVEMAVNTVY